MSGKLGPFSARHTSIDRESADPTPEEIRRRSAKIRKGWSKRVAERRQAWADRSWLPPLIMTMEIACQVNETQE